MLRISWVNRITNKEVLRRVSKFKNMETLRPMKTRKLLYHGHSYRNEKYDLFGWFCTEKSMEREAWIGEDGKQTREGGAVVQ